MKLFTRKCNQNVGHCIFNKVHVKYLVIVGSFSSKMLFVTEIEQLDRQPFSQHTSSGEVGPKNGANQPGNKSKCRPSFSQQSSFSTLLLIDVVPCDILWKSQQNEPTTTTTTAAAAAAAAAATTTAINNTNQIEKRTKEGSRNLDWGVLLWPVYLVIASMETALNFTYLLTWPLDEYISLFRNAGPTSRCEPARWWHFVQFQTKTWITTKWNIYYKIWRKSWDVSTIINYEIIFIRFKYEIRK